MPGAVLNVLHLATHLTLTATNEVGTMTKVTAILQMRKPGLDRLQDLLVGGGTSLGGSLLRVQWDQDYDQCPGLSSSPSRWSASPLPGCCPLTTDQLLASAQTDVRLLRKPSYRPPPTQDLRSTRSYALQAPCIFP